MDAASAFDFKLESPSIFQLLSLLLVFLGTILTLLTGWFQDNLGMIVISVIFAFMTLIALAVSRGEILSAGNWESNTVSFTIAFTLWALVGSSSGSTAGSVFAVGENTLYSTLSGQVPLIVDFLFQSFIIPYAEEYLWMVAIPYFTYGIMIGLDKSTGYKTSNATKLLATGLVSAVTFALFHIQNLNIISFLLGAMVFRTIMVIAVIGDQTNNWIPFLDVMPAFAFGAHIANNWAAFGLTRGLNLMLNVQSAYLFVVVAVILATIGSFLVSGYYFLAKRAFKAIA